MGKYTNNKILYRNRWTGKTGKVELYVRIFVALAVLVVVVVVQQKKRGSDQIGQKKSKSCVLSALVIIE